MYRNSPRHSRSDANHNSSSTFEVRQAGQFDDHGSTVWRVSWNMTGTIMASSGDDGCVRLWKGKQSHWLDEAIPTSFRRLAVSKREIFFSELQGQMAMHFHLKRRRGDATSDFPTRPNQGGERRGKEHLHGIRTHFVQSGKRSLLPARSLIAVHTDASPLNSKCLSKSRFFFVFFIILVRFERKIGGSCDLNWGSVGVESIRYNPAPPGLR